MRSKNANPNSHSCTSVFLSTSPIIAPAAMAVSTASPSLPGGSREEWARLCAPASAMLLTIPDQLDDLHEPMKLPRQEFSQLQNGDMSSTAKGHVEKTGESRCVEHSVQCLVSQRTSEGGQCNGQE